MGHPRVQDPGERRVALEVQGLEASFESNVATQLGTKFPGTEQLIDLQGQRVVANLISENQQASVGQISPASLSGQFTTTINSLTAGPIVAIGTKTGALTGVTQTFENQLGNIERALAEGTTPTVLDTARPFTAPAFSAAAARMPAGPRVVSLVPTQLQRILAHPEATAAIISGGTEITGHFANPPFQEQELAQNPDAHVILSSYDVLGGPASSTLLYATEDFYQDSPKTYQALLGALEEAAAFVDAHPEEAADIYLKVTGAKTDRKLLLDVITSDEVTFKVQPENTLGLGQFLHRVGAIRTEPTQLSDYFFADPRVQAGS